MKKLSNEELLVELEVPFPVDQVLWRVVGPWAVIYPEGALGSVKAAHSSIDANDSSIWWLPRLIGAFFLFFFVVLLALAFRGSWR